MTLQEIHLLLTQAARLDPRMGRTDADELLAMVREWHAVIGDLEYSVAIAAVREHYAQETRPLMPADVRGWARPVVETSESMARARWLAMRGITEEELTAMSYAELEAFVTEGMPGVAGA